MEHTAWLMLWFTSLVLTILSFIFTSASRRDKHPVLFIVSFVFWAATSVASQQIQFVMGDGLNTNIYDHEMGDWSGDVGLMWALYMMSVFCLIYGIWSFLRLSREEIADTVDRKNGGWPV